MNIFNLNTCGIETKAVLMIFLVLALSSCEKNPISPEVSNCLKNFKELNPQECLVRTSVGGYKMEFPLRFAPNFFLQDSNDTIGVRINYPADTQLSKYITTKNKEGEFLQANNVNFNGASIDNIISVETKFKSFKNSAYIAIRKSKASVPFSNILFNDRMKVIDDFKECDSGIKNSTEMYIFDNKEFSSRKFNLRYSGKIGDVCSVRIRALLEENVYLQMDVRVPVTDNGKSVVDWVEPIDWKVFLSAVDELLMEISI